MGFCCHGSGIFHRGAFRENLPENKFICNGHLSVVLQMDLVRERECVCVREREREYIITLSLNFTKILFSVQMI